MELFRAPGPGDETGGTRGTGGRSGEQRSRWGRFSAWLECVCVVTFDLELGQAIEVA